MENNILKLNKELAIEYFGECHFQSTITDEPSNFYRIIFKNFTLYIEEWIDDDILYAANLYIHDEAYGFSNTDLKLLLDEIKFFVEN